MAVLNVRTVVGLNVIFKGEKNDEFSRILLKNNRPTIFI